MIFLSYQIIPEPDAIVFKLSKQYSRLGVRKFSFSQRVVDEWNDYSDTLVCATSVNAFKNGHRLDKYFKNCGRI